MKKTIVVGVILLFLIVSVTPTIGISNNDDTTPPVTTISFYPSEPDGKNGWYVSDVNVTLNATDDISGVKEIHYRVAGGEWVVQSGDLVIFTLDDDCLIDGIIEFYAVDFADNQEEIKSVEDINIDQIPPCPTLVYEIISGNHMDGFVFVFAAEAVDDCSGMERVDFYVDALFLGTFYGPGPLYECMFRYSPSKIISGLILFKEINEEYVKFFAMIVKISSLCIGPRAEGYDNAGNMCWTECSPSMPDGFCLFRNVKLPNNFKGYIGNLFIFAEFERYLVEEEGLI